MTELQRRRTDRQQSALDALEALLAESVQSVVARESATFDVLAGPPPRPLVLMGAGGFGRRVLGCLRAAGMDPLAFADNDSRRCNTEVDGIPVMSPAQAIRRFGSAACFVVSIWGAGSGHRLEHTVAQLVALGAKRVVPAAALLWHLRAGLPHFALDLPSLVIERAARVRAAAQLLADDDSLELFVAQVRWRLWLDSSGLGPCHPTTEYFPEDLFRPSSCERFVDCGAFTGDTLEAFLVWAGDSFGAAWLLEPDPGTFRRLQDRVDGLPAGVRSRVQVRCAAAQATSGTVRFSSGAGLASTVDPRGDVVVDAVALDQVLGDESPTLLKMDIEGAELEALSGARRTLSRGVTRLAVCAYHRQDHLWEVPLRIHELCPAHQIHLRSHGTECWDTVAYAFAEPTS